MCMCVCVCTLDTSLYGVYKYIYGIWGEREKGRWCEITCVDAQTSLKLLEPDRFAKESVFQHYSAL